MLYILFFVLFAGSTFAFRPVTFRDHVLAEHSGSHHVYRSLQDTDWLNCIINCHNDPICISYNFVRSTDGLGVCEMINCGLEHLCDVENDLIYSSGAIFQQLAAPTVRLIILVLI